MRPPRQKNSFFGAAAVSLLAGAITFHLAGAAIATDFADAVISYDPGSVSDSASKYNNAATALGSPAPLVGESGSSPSVESVFDPVYESTQMVAIGSGGELTLQLSNYVATNTGNPGIGIFNNVGLTDVNYPNGHSDSGPSTFSDPASALVEVSPDNVHWYALNGGNAVLFDIPTNYFGNGGPFDGAAPANPVYLDFGKPFTGGLSSFANLDYSQIISLLDGSAGGTWLNLDSLPTDVPEIGYVRFSDVQAGEALYLDAVAGNSALTGSAVPEPSAPLLFGAGAAVLLTVCRRRRALVPGILALGASLVLPFACVYRCEAAAQVESYADITNWTGSGPNSAALVIDWADGKTYPGETGGESLVWGFHWSGSATGKQMIEAIAAADPRLFLNTNGPGGPNTIYGLGYDLDNSHPAYIPGPDDTGTLSDPNDHYIEGWDTQGYWSYWNFDGSGAFYPQSWTFASQGFASRTLTNGSWDAWDFSYYTDLNGDQPPSDTPFAAEPVPEPASPALLLAGAALLLRRKA